MPKLVDTTIRLLSQEPLAGRLPTAEILRVAEILDGAGFACLEISGGGVFDATVRRRVESPWERIRAIKARVSTPLGIALRGRFLVGSRPVSGDIVGRFVSCAAENGIEVFRLHDPLNDVSNLREAGAAITSAGGTFHAGLVYSPGRTDETDALVDQARKLPGPRRDASRRQRPHGRAASPQGEELVARIREASGLSVGFYVQGAAGPRHRVGTGRRRGGSGPRRDCRLSACSQPPPRLGRGVVRVARGARPFDRDPDRQAVGSRGRHRRVHRGRAGRTGRSADRRAGCGVRPAGGARRGARGSPSGSCRRRPSAGRPRGGRSRPRGGGLAAARGADRPDPGLAGAPARAGGEALRDRDRRVSSARPGRLRRDSRAGRPDRRARDRAARARARRSPTIPPTAEDVREQAEGLAASEEELVLIATFGSRRGRAPAHDPAAALA